MNELTDFLLARIAEDEAVAQAAWGDSWTALTMYPDRSVVVTTPRMAPASMVTTEHKDDETVEHIARHDPARVLAECEAKRQIVERADCECLCSAHGADYEIKGCAECLACHSVRTADGYVLADLAAVYADHPDYRDEWKP